MNVFFGFWHRIPIQRRKRIVLFALAVILVLLVFVAARMVLGFYAVGLLLAYLLAPVVRLFERAIEWFATKIRFGLLRRMARSLAILLSYLVLLAVLVGFVSMVVPIVSREGRQLWETREGIWDQATDWFEDIAAQFEVLPPWVQVEIERAIDDLTAYVTQIVRQAVQGTVVAVQYTFAIVLAITIIPFWTYFLLLDYGKLRDSMYASFPSGIRADLQQVMRLVDRTIGGYLRGQLVLMVVVGVMQAGGMALIGVPYALVLGVIAGVLEVVPSIGPTVAAIPAIMVALTISPWLALLAAGVARLVQMLENSFIVPRVLGESVGLHPVVMMVMLVVGAELGGLPGLILAPVLTAVLRDIYRYLAHRFGDEPCTPEEAAYRAIQDETFTLSL
jgi:predicted PurR-regulated permease PerM